MASYGCYAWSDLDQILCGSKGRFLSWYGGPWADGLTGPYTPISPHILKKWFLRHALHSCSESSSDVWWYLEPWILDLMRKHLQNFTGYALSNWGRKLLTELTPDVNWALAVNKRSSIKWSLLHISSAENGWPFSTPDKHILLKNNIGGFYTHGNYILVWEERKV